MSITQKLEPKVIYEDEYLLVIHKPAGLHSVAQVNSKDNSLSQWLVEKFPLLAKVGKQTGDSGLVQRLDYETSGLMLAAKNNEIWVALHEMIMQGQVEKYYFCLVQGILEQKLVRIESFIGSPYRRGKKVRVYKKKPSKPDRALAAETSFELIQANEIKNISLLRAFAPTARRHQVRAHAASIGHALVGDSLYGSGLEIGGDYPVRFYLQASDLAFSHPVSKKKLEFTCQVPEEITFFLEGHASVPEIEIMPEIEITRN